MALHEAFAATKIALDLRFVSNGEEFIDYLYRQPPWSRAERPDIILLDLDMTRINGLQILLELRRDSELKSIPVVVLADSRDPEDIAKADMYGANTYIAKPLSGAEMNLAVRILCEFWFKICALPGSKPADRTRD